MKRAIAIIFVGTFMALPLVAEKAANCADKAAKSTCGQAVVKCSDKAKRADCADKDAAKCADKAKRADCASNDAAKCAEKAKADCADKKD